ncbi:WD40 repeat domain-containing protein [Calycomorphotria hydatis]|uniref:WD domain, G-beta repeat n=1 Tax=Calycomorphotria hydatis TaxID=2528027 RepID=A0A517TFE8_9PLAN|nr:hypothetical protein [Calycomorphotria hydatis]QDT67101.1 hypothetical protein V22_43740 [Calycomorphotria hydatis]
MSYKTSDQWLADGEGASPMVHWSFWLDAPLAAMAHAREVDETVAADRSGGLYRFDRDGNIIVMTRGMKGVEAIAVADVGGLTVVALRGNRVALLDQRMSVVSTVRMPDMVLDLALDPFGQHLAVALANTEVRLLSVSDRKLKKSGQFRAARSLKHIAFHVEEPLLIGAAEYGLLCGFTHDGRAIWDVKLWANCGSMSLAGNGKSIALSGFNHGVQLFSGKGDNQGTLMMDGSPNLASLSYDGKRIVVGTLEGHVCLLTSGGRTMWVGKAPEEVTAIQCDAFGHSAICATKNGQLVRLAWDIIGPTEGGGGDEFVV